MKRGAEMKRIAAWLLCLALAVLCAQAAAEQAGMKSLSAAEMTPQGFATIALLMLL